MKINFEKVYFCTGARNQALLNYFRSDLISFDYDERMASFKALGRSKVAKNPVAICTTSGTAVSECVSAMIEAYYSELPLVLITGDRPKKLHGTGSPQTIDHEQLTRSCRKSFIEIELKDFADLKIDQLEYPIHINVIVDDTFNHDLKTVIHTDMDGFENFISKYKRPLFLFSHERVSMRLFIEEFSKLNLPFYSESLGQGRDLSKIKTERDLTQLFNSNYFDSVIRIGHTPLSKTWRLLEKKHLPVFHFDSRGLPALSYGEILKASANNLLRDKKFWSIIRNLEPHSVSNQSNYYLKELIDKYPESEITTFSKLNKLINEDDTIYLGNSLVIRFFELTQVKRLDVFGNRGVNGIDGQLATAIGLCDADPSKKVYCILGDITAAYDLSSMRELPQNLHLIIINNKGGRIFEMLNLDKRIILEHENDFEKISHGMGLTYSRELADFGKVQVLELFPDRTQSQKMLQEWGQ
jgi:2-succinyl-5-enolpyruvyl-6-hydroxy-3-cyclohexene-1-carboxylate synthase